MCERDGMRKLDCNISKKNCKVALETWNEEVMARLSVRMRVFQQNEGALVKEEAGMRKVKRMSE